MPEPLAVISDNVDPLMLHFAQLIVHVVRSMVQFVTPLLVASAFVIRICTRGKRILH